MATCYLENIDKNIIFLYIIIYITFMSKKIGLNQLIMLDFI